MKPDLITVLVTLFGYAATWWWRFDSDNRKLSADRTWVLVAYSFLIYDALRRWWTG